MANEVVEKSGVSRRSFLKGAGAVVGAAVIGFPSVQKALAQALPPSVVLPKETMLEMYRRMQRLRIGTAKGSAAKISVSGCLGEEASHVGVGMALNKGDYITTTHNCDGEILGSGLDVKRWMAEAAGKATGFNRGHAGRWMVAMDQNLGITVDGSPMVAHGVPHAVGAAKAYKLRGVSQVAVAVNGDGAMNASGFNSSLNMAAVWKVPVVFVVVNNQWENHASIRETQALSRAGKDLAVRASGFAIPGYTVDGNDVFAVYKAAQFCIDQARTGNGPSMLECATYGISKGSIVAGWPWNNPAELDYWKARDPIKRFETTVLSGLLTQQDLDTVVQAVTAEVDEAIAFTTSSAYPDPEEEFKYARATLGA